MTKKTLMILAGLALVLAAPLASPLSAATKTTQIMQQLEAKSAKIVPSATALHGRRRLSAGHREGAQHHSRGNGPAPGRFRAADLSMRYRFHIRHSGARRNPAREAQKQTGYRLSPV